MRFLAENVVVSVMLFLVALTLIVPATGGLFLKFACRLLADRRISYQRCWAAYLAAYAAASVLMTGAVTLAVLLVPGGGGGLSALAWCAVVIGALAIHAAIIPRILKLPLRQSLPA